MKLSFTKAKFTLKDRIIFLIIVINSLIYFNPLFAQDTIPPLLSNGQPNGTLAFGTTEVIVSVTTNENAICKYSIGTTRVDYDSMQNTFTTTGGTSHSFTLTNLSNGVAYNIYVRCRDEAGNTTTTDYPISFNVSSGSSENGLNKILFIGNSFTGHSGGIHNHLQKMMDESGRTIEVAGEIHGGEAFSRLGENYPGQANRPEVTERINSDSWDAVVLQSYVEPVDSFYSAGGKLIDRVRNNNSEPVLFMTWGRKSYPEQDSTYKHRAEQLGAEKNVKVAPIGIGIRTANTQGVDIYSDEEHLSLKGAYLAAAMYYSFFTGKSPVGLTYDGYVGSGYFGRLTPEETSQLQTLAWQVINDYGVFFESSNNNASNFEYIMGDALFPYNPLPKPAKGDSIIDPNFGTTITRITDGEANVPNAGIYPEYGTYRSINQDETKILLVDRNGYYRIHSALPPYQTIKKWKPDWSSNGGLGHEQPEYRWDYSGNHSTRIYWRANKKLIQTEINDIPDGGILTIDNSVNTVVHDFNNDRTIIEAGTPLADDIWNNAVIANGDAGTSSEDSRYWVFALYTADGSGKTYYRIFVYDKSADTVVAAKNVEGGYVNEVYMSPDGEYVYVGFNAKDPYNDTQTLGGGWMYKRDFSNWGDPKYFMCSIPPHTNWMYDAQGYVGMLYPDNQTDYLTFKRAVDGTEWNIRYALQGEGADWGRGGKHHGAMPGPHRRGWGLVTTYTTKYFDHQGWEDDAIYLVEVDENKYYGGAQEPRVWRIATLNNNSTVNYYFHHPNASMNYDGTKIWFGSNWGIPDGIQDVYQITLPGNWWNDLKDGTVSVDKNNHSLELNFNLMQNYPNPFNPTTTIQYTIPMLETLHATSQRVLLKVYNILGKEVTTLVNENQKSGSYTVTWNATNQPSGIYFYRITADNFTETKRMVLLK